MTSFACHTPSGLACRYYIFLHASYSAADAFPGLGQQGPGRVGILGRIEKYDVGVVEDKWSWKGGRGIIESCFLVISRLARVTVKKFFFHDSARSYPPVDEAL